MPHKSDQRPVTLWLFVCCAFIFVMALIGAITRLTESGLSITTWDPVMGVLPPLTTKAWQQAFTSYQAIPQYQLLHQGMTLDDFKNIFFWEWLHRLWGRLIGFVFALPLIFFLVTRRIDRKSGFKFILIFLLGGLQGFVGWYMVQSGLEVRTSVSPYRLALHLSFALLIYSILFWTALDTLPSHEAIYKKTRPLIRYHGLFALLCLVVTVVWGAFVAGLHAGLVYNSWPLMDGDFIPSAATTLQPLWTNVFENTALVQFIHRWLAPFTILVILLWVKLCWSLFPRHQLALAALALMALVQASLGLSTLLSHVDISLAVLHQAGAITLLTLLLFNLHHLFETKTSRR